MPTQESLIEVALQRFLPGATVLSTTPLGGGGIHEVRAVRLEDGRVIVAKIGGGAAVAMLETEALGLEALGATGAVRVPEVLGMDRADAGAVLLLEHLDGPVEPSSWRRLGEALADLHDQDAGECYGFDHDNFLGATSQVNGWHEDWIAFNDGYRLGPQLREARDAGRLDAAEARAVQGVLDRLDRLLPGRPHPSLLHGDLWSGNIVPAGAGALAVLDPACSVGDGWADIAMLRLFGGVPSSLHEVYASRRPHVHDLDARIDVYQLYHLLNHVNLFGGAYVSGVMERVRRLS